MGEVLGERGRFGGGEPPLSRGGSPPPRSFSSAFQEGALSLQTSLTHRELPPCPRLFRSENLVRFWRVAGAWGKFLCLGRYEFVAACGYRACFVGGKRSDITLYTSAGVMGKVFVFGEV